MAGNVSRGAMLLVCIAAGAARAAPAQCPDGSPPPCRGATRAAPPANSVAVLYFDNESRDSSDLYLADGLTEEIISRLSGIERLTVRSRHLVRRYRGAPLADPAEAGRALHAAYLVTGSIRRAGARLRVSAELIRAASGQQVWGRQFDQAGDDIFAIQEAVAREVTTGIVGRMVPAERVALAERPTRSGAAYDAYLRGNFHLARRDSVGFARAIAEYERALRADPDFTDALSRIALAYGLVDANAINLGADLPPDSLAARALRAAGEAVRRAPRSSESWLGMALARFAGDPLRLTGVREANERAVALDSSSAEAHHQLAWTLMMLGDTAAARRHDHLALAIEPARPVTLMHLAHVAGAAGRWDECLRWSDSALALDRDFAGARLIRLLAVLMRDGRAAASDELGRWSPPTELRLAWEFFRTTLTTAPGDTAAVRAFRTAAFGAVPGSLPAAQAGLGGLWWLASLQDVEGAVMALALGRRGLYLRSYLSFTAFDPIRGDPRFQRVWRESSP